MSWNNRIIWSEGLFLRPQHFQQSDRHFDKLLRTRVDGLAPYPWGLTELKLNRDLLGLGKFAIERAVGVLEDGTPFSIPEDADQPTPLDIPDTTRNSVVYLTLPAYQPGAAEAVTAGVPESAARFVIADQEVGDAVDTSRVPVAIEVGKLRFKLMLESAERRGLICLGLARIQEVRSDKKILLDEEFIPPSLDCAGAQKLLGYITEIQSLLHHRGEELAGRVVDSGTKGSGEVTLVTQFLFLNFVNRYEPLFAHLAAAQNIHPELFYRHALQLAGELAAFTAASRRPPAYPRYKHDDLAASFAPLMALIRQGLASYIPDPAVAIPLQEDRYAGVYIAPIADRTLISTAAFVLSVKANVDAERLRRLFPNQVKVAPVESIAERVNNQLPAIAVRPLQVVPRQIPYHSGNSYFELDRTGRDWEELKASGVLALHVSDEFPGLEMQLWAIRGA